MGNERNGLLDEESNYEVVSPHKNEFNWCHLVLLLGALTFFGLLITSSPIRFPVSDSKEAPLVFFSIGDWGRAGSHNQSALADRMGIVGEQMNPSFVISNGDNFYDEGLKSGNDDFFTESFTKIYSQKSLQIPWISILGNHDYYGNVSAQFDPLLKQKDWRWSCIKSGVFCGHLSSKNDSKSLVDFFVLDTVPLVKYYRFRDDQHTLDWTGIDTKNFDEYNKLQLEELEKNLNQSTAKWKIVLGHHPVYSYGEHGNTAELIEGLKPILERQSVDIYMNGHDHDMQHIKRGDSPVHFITSGGGSKAFQQAPPEASEGLSFFWEGQGFAALEISKSHVHVQFIGLEGVMYSFKIFK